MNRTMKLVFKEGPIMYLDGVENFGICSENNMLLKIKYLENLSEGRFECHAFFDISDLLYFGWADFLNNNLNMNAGI